MPTPCRIASFGAWNTRGSPFIEICPASGRYSPARMLMSVLLPAPFSPSRACTSPQRAEKSTPWLAITPGKALSMATMANASSLVTRRLAYRGAVWRRLTFGNVADDIGERPVHLVALCIGVVLGLAWLGRWAFV